VTTPARFNEFKGRRITIIKLTRQERTVSFIGITTIEQEIEATSDGSSGAKYMRDEIIWINKSVHHGAGFHSILSWWRIYHKARSNAPVIWIATIGRESEATSEGSPRSKWILEKTVLNYPLIHCNAGDQSDERYYCRLFNRYQASSSLDSASVTIRIDISKFSSLLLNFNRSMTWHEFSRMVEPVSKTKDS
jgi:hypothetical protein